MLLRFPDYKFRWQTAHYNGEAIRKWHVDTYRSIALLLTSLVCLPFAGCKEHELGTLNSLSFASTFLRVQKWNSIRKKKKEKKKTIHGNAVTFYVTLLIIPTKNKKIVRTMRICQVQNSLLNFLRKDVARVYTFSRGVLCNFAKSLSRKFRNVSYVTRLHV